MKNQLILIIIVTFLIGFVTLLICIGLSGSTDEQKIEGTWIDNDTGETMVFTNHGKVVIINGNESNEYNFTQSDNILTIYFNVSRFILNYEFEGDDALILYPLELENQKIIYYRVK